MKFYGSKKTYRKEMSKIIGNNIEREEERKRKNNQKSTDTIERQAIRDDIIRMIKEGKGRLAVVDYLLNTYEDSKLSIYFSQWYDYYYERIKKEKSVINDDEGR